MTVPEVQEMMRNVATASGEDALLELSLGPHHPSTHGVFRMDVVLDGERVMKLKPVFGYLHRNHEKIAESASYLASGCSLNFLNSSLNQCGKRLLMALTDSPIFPRLGAVPPVPACSGTAMANRSSNAAATMQALPKRECPTTAMRRASTLLSVTR